MIAGFAGGAVGLIDDALDVQYKRGEYPQASRWRMEVVEWKST